MKNLSRFALLLSGLVTIAVLTFAPAWSQDKPASREARPNLAKLRNLPMRRFHTSQTHWRVPQ